VACCYHQWDQLDWSEILILWSGCIGILGREWPEILIFRLTGGLDQDLRGGSRLDSMSGTFVTNRTEGGEVGFGKSGWWGVFGRQGESESEG